MTELKLTFSEHALNHENNSPNPYRWMKWFAIAAAACIVAPLILSYATLWVAYTFFSVRTFHAGSDTMCPTLCENEKFLARMDGYAGRTPQRGDVIMVKIKDEPLSYAKRIVGVEGDVITPAGDTILVNNKALEIPKECGQPPSRPSKSTEMPPFEPTTVPKDSYFVIGDNLPQSYDSRYFGAVSRDQIRGQILYIYWSSGSGRIGCAIR